MWPNFSACQCVVYRCFSVFSYYKTSIYSIYMTLIISYSSDERKPVKLSFFFSIYFYEFGVSLKGKIRHMMYLFSVNLFCFKISVIFFFFEYRKKEWVKSSYANTKVKIISNRLIEVYSEHCLVMVCILQYIAMK